MHIIIQRTSTNSNSITGELYVDGKYVCQTLELPQKDNKTDISSIPAGNYGGILRYDHADKWRIELTDTPSRTHIQIHIGNYPSNSKGCILVGEKVDTNNNTILNSTVAYTRLKAAFYGTANPISTPNNPITIEIKNGFGPVPLSAPPIDFKL